VIPILAIIDLDPATFVTIIAGILTAAPRSTTAGTNPPTADRRMAKRDPDVRR
jgi:hypothetical protein